MSVRVVARIRPLLAKELDQEIIVQAESTEPGTPATIVRIPNPRNETEEFSFTFNGVYDGSASQEALFGSEVAPHLKSLFQGIDVTIFAYGVTGTGKTHTMRGGLKLADRGVIPRLLSGIFRRGKKIMKETEGNTTVRIALSYYEIYNDKVFDLLEGHEKRTPAGLPLRAEANGKTVVVGLTERACSDIKEFEKLYIEANNNRATAATKLNAHSSRSHAILRVKVTQTTGPEVRESTASAIDLAGSEDNRRTDNAKERLVESAAINKSLFVLGQCIDAISRGDKRIPYRESKMTRILSLGQNDGITVMILNLSPLRCSHLDTLSSLNISSRAKRIEVREIENEVVFKQMPRTNITASGSRIRRQPLRPLANAINILNVAGGDATANKDPGEVAKPIRAFSVFSDKVVRPRAVSRLAASTPQTQIRPPKRRSDSQPPTRPKKQKRLHTTTPATVQQGQASAAVSAAEIEAMVEKKVNEILAARNAAAEESVSKPEKPDVPHSIKKRLEALERRIESEESRDDAKSEGLRHLLAARQAKQLGNETAALRAYEKALPFFPDQPRLLGKIEKLRAKLESTSRSILPPTAASETKRKSRKVSLPRGNEDEDEPPHEDTFAFLGKSRPKATSISKSTSKGQQGKEKEKGGGEEKEKEKEKERDFASPRTRSLLEVINSGDVARIKNLAGFGSKRAQYLVDRLSGAARIESLDELRSVPGLGGKTVDRAYKRRPSD